MARKPSTKTIYVEILKHKDKRANIPTRELQDFVKDEEQSPKTLLYPRDPSLDPRLARKDKEAKVATAKSLWVPAVNNHGAFGRWDFIEIKGPWDAQTEIRSSSAYCGTVR